MRLETKKGAFSFGALIQTTRNYFKTDTISGLTKALEKEKAESIRKSKRIFQLYEKLEHCIEYYADRVYYDNINSYVSKEVVDRPGAKSGEDLKPEVKKEIKRLYEHYDVYVPEEYLTEDELLERCEIEQANMMAGVGIL